MGENTMEMWWGGRQTDRQTAEAEGEREHELSEGLAPGMASGFWSCTQIYEGLS